MNWLIVRNKMKYFRTFICLLNPVSFWYYAIDRHFRCQACGRIVSGGFLGDDDKWTCTICISEGR